MQFIASHVRLAMTIPQRILEFALIRFRQYNHVAQGIRMNRISFVVTLAALYSSCLAACEVEPTPVLRPPRPTRTPVTWTRTPTFVLSTRAAVASTVTQTRVPTRSSTPTRAATATDVPPTRTRVSVPALPTPTLTPAPAPRPLVWDPRLDELKIQYIPADVSPGENYWRLTRAEFWAESENQGKNHIFVNVLDENGARLVGETITIEWLDGSHLITTEDKPAPEYSANFPMDINHYPPWHTLGAYSARVNGLPSDVVQGMGRPPPKSRPVVYLLTFQRTVR
jgi:hypothetical protein